MHQKKWALLSDGFNRHFQKKDHLEFISGKDFFRKSEEDMLRLRKAAYDSVIAGRAKEKAVQSTLLERAGLLHIDIKEKPR